MAVSSRPVLVFFVFPSKCGSGVEGDEVAVLGRVLTSTHRYCLSVATPQNDPGYGKNKTFSDSWQFEDSKLLEDRLAQGGARDFHFRG